MIYCYISLEKQQKLLGGWLRAKNLGFERISNIELLLKLKSSIEIARIIAASLEHKLQ